jgi:hypothetical protein
MFRLNKFQLLMAPTDGGNADSKEITPGAIRSALMDDANEDDLEVDDDKIDDKAFKALIRAAVALNTSESATPRPSRSQKKPKSD